MVFLTQTCLRYWSNFKENPMTFVAIVVLLQVIDFLSNFFMARYMNIFQIKIVTNCIKYLYIFTGSDHQTFSMTLPPRLRDYYDKVVTPASGGNTIIGIERFFLFNSFS